MASMSDYLENKLIDFLFRGVAFSPPSTLYVGLFTVTPSDAGGGTEATGTNYTRASVSSSLSTFNTTQGNTASVSTGTSGSTANALTIPFPSPGGAGWGTAVAIGLFDASTSGNLLWWGSLSSNMTIASGATVSFAAGALTLQIDN